MKEIIYTLLTDGSSDRRLIPILTWLLRQHCPEMVIVGRWVDLSDRPPKKKQKNQPKEKPLESKIKTALARHYCDILFVHRDAETISNYNERVIEIQRAIKKLSADHQARPTICVVTVRMTEAWLLFNETAIRIASGNKKGRKPLELPGLKGIEDKPYLKAVLEQSLITASEFKGGRRLARFKRDISERAFNVAENIEDFSPLRELKAFQSLEAELKEVLGKMSCCL
ncbi:MAG: hypothetical protein HQK97_08090 [Nitrospirae bacterium]|nr:hypothetical protein [Nitrospirota bacterium]